MTIETVVAVALAGMLAQTPVNPTNDLAAVKDLYASASFEEALTRLASVQERLGTEQTEQYRALCLLGLGRTSEAQTSLERMVTANPLYSFPESDVSPRLVSMYRDVRKRLLPAAARDLYQRAKVNFDNKQYAAAAAQFREMIAVIADDDMGDRAAALSDLKQVGEGFLKLADAEVISAAKASQAASQAAAAARAAVVPAAPPAPAAPMVYSAANGDVTGPTDLDRRLPQWNAPTVLARTMEFRGSIEVVVNERGLVESVTITKPIAPTYDPVLLNAAKNWKFQPATLNGAPVKYRKSFEIVLAPQRR
jgi:tetratricopeptide (TPR) repeat protein